MTFDAWRSAVGDAWLHLLLYPSGLALLLLGLVLMRVFATQAEVTLSPRGAWAGLVPLVVAVAGLPLPGTGEMRAPLDLLTVWLALDAPLLLALALAWRGALDQQWWLIKALTGWLVAAPLQGLVLVVLGWQTRSLTLQATLELGWPAGLVWAITLVPLLQLGPWRCELSGPWALALNMRRAGHCGVVVLWAVHQLVPRLAAWLPSRAAVIEDGRLPAALLLLGLILALWGIDRVGRSRSVLRWGRAWWLFGALLLGWLAAQTLAQFVAR